MERSAKTTPVSVRIHEDLDQWLRKEAARNFRTLSGEVMARLEESRQRQEAEEQAKK